MDPEWGIRRVDGDTCLVQTELIQNRCLFLGLARLQPGCHNRVAVPWKALSSAAGAAAVVADLRGAPEPDGPSRPPSLRGRRDVRSPVAAMRDRSLAGPDHPRTGHAPRSPLRARRALRPTPASSRIAAGLDVVSVGRRLGHANPALTLSV